MVRVFLSLAALALATGCLVRDNPCADDSRAPRWLSAQCQAADAGADTDTGTASETGMDPVAGDTGPEVMRCEHHGDCCPDSGDSECDKKCVFVRDKGYCYGSGTGINNDSCDRLEEHGQDTCDQDHVCVAHVENFDELYNEGYCKPLCTFSDGCSDLGGSYTCTINGLCREPCVPLDDGCLHEEEACRWIRDEDEGLFNCQPINPVESETCHPQLDPDRAGECEQGQMCVLGADLTYYCADFCFISDGCGERSCEPFNDKVHPNLQSTSPALEDIGFCSK